MSDLDFGPNAQLGLAPVDLVTAAAYFRDEEFKELIDAAPALITELHVSRKVVEAARYIADSEPWHDANVRDLKEVLAELDSLIDIGGRRGV